MTKSIFRAIWLVASLILMISFLGLSWGTYRSFSQQQDRSLKSHLTTLVQMAEQEGSESLMTFDMGDYRLTLVGEDGEVLYDSRVNRLEMTNHARRKEIRDALRTGEGKSIRYSTTVTQQTVYKARRLSSGDVLRLSISYTSFLGTLRQLWFLMFTLFLLSLLLAYGSAHLIAERIMGPINQIDLENPLSSDVYPEFSPLLNRLAQLKSLNQSQIELIRQKEAELQLITQQMGEGLIILNQEDRVISLNHSAYCLFSLNQDLIGQPFFTISHAYDLKQAMEKAKETGHEQIFLEDGSAYLQINISRVTQADRMMGLVLLIVDVTEQRRIEQLRREFTANVSHELKTPLQTIMGASELLEGGLVSAKDQPQFMSKIRKEAARLLTLIEDTLKLSQLDEQFPMEMETVDLKALIEGVGDELQEAARLKGIIVEKDLKAVQMVGHRRLLRDIIYNLLDNAIRYSPEKSRIQLGLWQTDSQISFSVKDQGPGIDEAEQERIFERFYRVDKSHSRRTGGTGLGLSIVQKAVDYHKGQIEVVSQPGLGSAFTVTFNRTD